MLELGFERIEWAYSDSSSSVNVQYASGGTEGTGDSGLAEDFVFFGPGVNPDASQYEDMVPFVDLHSRLVTSNIGAAIDPFTVVAKVTSESVRHIGSMLQVRQDPRVTTLHVEAFDSTVGSYSRLRYGLNVRGVTGVLLETVGPELRETFTLFVRGGTVTSSDGQDEHSVTYEDYRF